MKITLNEILHNPELKEIQTASELFFAQAIAYSVEHLMADTTLDVSNIRVAHKLAHCPFVSDCIKSGLHFAGVTKSFATPYTAAPDVDDRTPAFLKKFNAYVTALHRCSDGVPTDLFECEFFKIDEDDANHLTIYNTDIARIYGTTVTSVNPDAYVYALAMLTVVAYISGKTLRVTLRPDTAKQTYEFAHVYILQLMGNRMLAPLSVTIEDDTLELDKQRWAALVFERRLFGYYLPETVHTYSIEEKNNAMFSTDLRVGDIVLIYKSTQDTAHNDLACMTFSNCEAGVILSIEYAGSIALGFTIQVLETLATQATVNALIDAGIASGNKLYLQADKKKCNKPVRSYMFKDCGLGGCAGSNSTLLMPIPDGVQDEKSPNYEQYLEYNKEGTDVRKCTLDIYDTIYTTFCDRGVEFDKERFRHRYFGDRVPEYETRMYQIWHNTDTVADVKKGGKRNGKST